MTDAWGHVVITGGAQGIGLGLARHFIGLGARVSVFDADEEALDAVRAELADIDRCGTWQVDVSQAQEVATALAEAAARFGPIAGLVNNAGLANPDTGPLEELDLAVWERYLAVDLTGPMLMVKHALAHLAAAAAIVNIASTRALQSEPYSECYASAKAGLVGLTHALAISLAGRARVNVVSPGWIEVSDHAKPAARQPVELRHEDHAQHPAGRVGRPQDIAAMCEFLLSPRAGFITGAHFIVDGGMTRKMQYLE